MIEKSIDKILENFKEKLLEKGDFSIKPGSVISDVILLPLSLATYSLNFIADFITKIQSLPQILELLKNQEYLEELASILGKSVEDLKIELRGFIEEKAKNFGIERKGPTFATGYVVFGRLSPPDFDLVVPRGLKVFSVTNQTYETTESRIMYANLASQYYNISLDAYVIEVPVRAINAGSIGNAEPNTITRMSSLGGFSFVTNLKPIMGGKDEETDNELIERVKNTILGNSLGTKNGLKKKILDNFIEVMDVCVVDAGHYLMERDSNYGGCVDIYIKGSRIKEKFGNIYYNGQDDISYIPKEIEKPLIDLRLILPSPYSAIFHKDNRTVFRNSVKSLDFIEWQIKPPAGFYQVRYSYNELIKEIQEFLDKEENKLLNFDILIKEAIPIPIEILFEIITLPGFSKSEVISKVIEKIETNISLFKLGQSLEQSDVINWVYEVQGVDRVKLPFIKFNKIGFPQEDKIEVKDNEYITLFSINVV